MSLTLTDIGNDAPKSLRISASRPNGSDRPSSEAEQRASLYSSRGKRVFDLVAASALIVLFAPLIAFLLLLVAIDGGRPLFAHRRVGQRGRVFGCLKVRSMRHNAEAELAAILASDPEAAKEWAEGNKLTNDPRVTTLGRFLRKSSLDELPQLFNVLRGEMSIVGPRPVTFDELSRYGHAAGAYLALKPGLTGPWQVSGRNDISYGERVALDAEYGQTMSLVSDVRIILMTGLSVLKLTGK